MSRGGLSPCRIVLCALGLGLILLPGTAAADVADDDYNRAAGFYRLMKWEFAAEEFGKFVEAHPKHEKTPTARFYLGLSRLNLKEYTPARAAFRVFIKEAPTSRHFAHALYRVGECSYLLNDWKAAEPELVAYLAKYPDEKLAEYALFYLGDAQLRLEKPRDAVQQFQKAREKFPKGSLEEDNTFGLARAEEALKNYPAAIKLYEELAARPQGMLASEALFNLGARHFEDRTYPAAIAAYGRLIKDFPTSPRVSAARLNRGFALYESGAYQQAAEQFEEAAADEKLAFQASYWKGMSFRALGDYPAAITVLQAAFEKNPADPLAETVLYRWAEAEQRRRQPAAAGKLYLDLVKRWPQGELADDALHAAGVAALEAGEVAETESLLGRFTDAFPGSPLRAHQAVLKGRLEQLKGDPAKAAPLFEQVIKTSELETATASARYHLGYALHDLQRYAEAIAATDPLVQDGKAAGVEDLFVLRGADQLALAKKQSVARGEVNAEDRKLFEQARLSALRYRELLPAGGFRDRALAIQAQAAAHAGTKEAARSYVAELLRDFPESPEAAPTLFDVAGVGYANEDWPWAAELYGTLATKYAQSTFAPRALFWQGWAEYKQNRFAEAAALFVPAREALKKQADAVPAANRAELWTLAAEAGFMHGKSLQDAGQKPEAVAAYQAAFQEFHPEDAAYKAGLQQARVLGELTRVPEADAAYEALAKQFPKHDNLDRIFDEWALLNYAAENYARSDEIFRRLIQERPDSELADNAELSLAESELVSGKLAEAAARFRALPANPKADAEVKQVALYHLIDIALEQKNWKDVGEQSQRLSDDYPQGKYRWFAEFHRAEADMNRGQFAAAHDRLLQVMAQKEVPAVREAAWWPQVWVLMAETQLQQKQHARVAATVAELRADYPKSDALYLADEVLGRSFKAQAMFPEAREAFLRVTKNPAGRLTETAAKSQFMIAETYLLEKNFAAAEKAYLEVEILYQFPDWQAPALFQAAACQEELGQWASAVKSYEALIKQYPENEFAAKAKERLPAARKKAETA